MIPCGGALWTIPCGGAPWTPSTMQYLIVLSFEKQYFAKSAPGRLCTGTLYPERHITTFIIFPT
eukprot:5128420-Amphidinium_carterae.1